MRKVALTLLAAVAMAALTGCASSTTNAAQPAAHKSVAHAVAPSAGASDATTSGASALGTSSKASPYPDCSLAAANWTATQGPIWVTVMTDGVDTITVAITTKAGSVTTQTFTIPGGEDTHIFEFKTIDPNSVKTVLVTASGNGTHTGGSCWATGSPTA